MLPRIASHDYQRRYIDHPTADNYVLPEELLEIVQNAVEVSLKDRDFTASLNNQQKECLERLLVLIKDESLSLDFDAPEVINSLVDQNPAWMVVRNQAKACLEAFYFDLAKWESENIH
jgi:hypothetical protein